MKLDYIKKKKEYKCINLFSSSTSPSGFYRVFMFQQHTQLLLFTHQTLKKTYYASSISL